MNRGAPQPRSPYDFTSPVSRWSLAFALNSRHCRPAAKRRTPRHKTPSITATTGRRLLCKSADVTVTSCLPSAHAYTEPTLIRGCDWTLRRAPRFTHWVTYFCVFIHVALASPDRRTGSRNVGVDWLIDWYSIIRETNVHAISGNRQCKQYNDKNEHKKNKKHYVYL